ncbi:MAG TPA: hypothetical protein VMV18_01375 [bacterium]|nr:hypothetical protein [bacterium]
MRRHLLVAAALAATLATFPRHARAQVSLEPDDNRFGTVRADGARISPSHWWNPYGPNVLKGDVPFAGKNNYVVFTGILDNQYDDTGAAKSGTRAAQTAANTMLLSLEYFNGETVFRAKNISFRGTLVAKTAQALANETGANRKDVYSVGESFMEVLLANHSHDLYDTSSARFGAQAVNFDVEGLVLNDVVLGAREFSLLRGNRYILNFLYERPLRKQNGLVVVDQSKDLTLEADVAAANLFVGDFLVPGFNLIAVAAYDDDRRNPASRLRVGYGALASNGHIGRFVTAPAVYLAWGDADHDDTAAGVSHGSRVLAPMAVLDIARPTNAWNPRFTALWAPGDKNVFDKNQNSYDAIADKVAFAGGAGAGIFAGTGINVKDENGNTVTLFHKGSVIPSLRGVDQRPNFIGPGILLADIGTDLAISPRWTTAFDVTAFNWDQPKALQELLFPSGGQIHSYAGSEAIAQIKFKPFLNEQALVTVSGAALFPGKGLQDLGSGSATQLKGDARILLAF